MLMAHENAFLQFRTSRRIAATTSWAAHWVMGMAGAVPGPAASSSMGCSVSSRGRFAAAATRISSIRRTVRRRENPRSPAPHDLWMELSRRTTLRCLCGAWQCWRPGRPSLPWPVAYPHRVSALSNPLAPITHHWFDRRSVVCVCDGGIYGRRWKSKRPRSTARAGREPQGLRFRRARFGIRPRLVSSHGAPCPAGVRRTPEGSGGW